MGRQKAVIKARREAKRVIRRDSRSHRQREEENVTSLVQMGGVESIGMARTAVIPPLFRRVQKLKVITYQP